MSGAGAPPLWAVLGSLGNIILSVGMMWYILLFLSSCGTCGATVAYVFLLHLVQLSCFRIRSCSGSYFQKKNPVRVLACVKSLEIEAKSGLRPDKETFYPPRHPQQDLSSAFLDLLPWL
jgi:hypothetical protein